MENRRKLTFTLICILIGISFHAQAGKYQVRRINEKYGIILINGKKTYKGMVFNDDATITFPSKESAMRIHNVDKPELNDNPVVYASKVKAKSITLKNYLIEVSHGSTKGSIDVLQDTLLLLDRLRIPSTYSDTDSVIFYSLWRDRRGNQVRSKLSLSDDKRFIIVTPEIFKSPQTNPLELKIIAIDIFGEALYKRVWIEIIPM